MIDFGKKWSALDWFEVICCYTGAIVLVTLLFCVICKAVALILMTPLPK